MTDKALEEYRKDQECKEEIEREAQDKKKPDGESEKYRKRRQWYKDAINRYQQRARIACGATAKNKTGAASEKYRGNRRRRNPKAKNKKKTDEASEKYREEQEKNRP
ncbi:hypothetical protein BG005_001001 [Podila minutissima]|nr:hypothetical protein BG005_001001 [Podila minutissima]